MNSIVSMTHIPADIVGVIAEFVPQTTEAQRTLMLVCNTWYRGVIEQDGMKPKPGIQWPWCALQERQPRSVTLDRTSNDIMRRLAAAVPTLKELIAFGNDTESFGHLSQLQSLESISFTAKNKETPLPFEHLAAARCSGSLGSLKTLRMKNYSLTDGDLALLADGNFTEHLTSLDISTEFLEDRYGSEALGTFCSRVRFPQLRELHLVGWSLFDDERLQQLLIQCGGPDGDQHGLTSFALHSCYNMSDATISVLVEKGAFSRRMASLDLSDCSNITDESVKLIAQLRQLKVLNLSRCKRVTDLGAEHIATNLVASLTSFSCRFTCITESGIMALATNRVPLQELKIGNIEISPTASRQMATHFSKTLTSLEMPRCSICDDGLREFGDHFHQLKSLDMSFCTGSGFSTVGLAGLAMLRNTLTTLILRGGSAILAEGWKQIGTMEHLTALDVSGNRDAVQGEAITEFCALKHLRILRLEGTHHLSDAMVEAIAENLPQLRTFAIARSQNISDLSFKIIGQKMHHLNELTINCRGSSDEGIHALLSGLGGATTNLISLSMMYSGMTQSPHIHSDAAFQSIASLTTLKYLSLSMFSGITNTTIDVIAKIDSLRKLNIVSCRNISENYVRNSFSSTPCITT